MLLYHECTNRLIKSCNHLSFVENFRRFQKFQYLQSYWVQFSSCRSILNMLNDFEDVDDAADFCSLFHILPGLYSIAPPQQSGIWIVSLECRKCVRLHCRFGYERFYNTFAISWTSFDNLLLGCSQNVHKHNC